MPTKSYIAMIRQGMRENKATVMALLQWDDLQYAEYQERMGYEYLAVEFYNIPFANELPYNSEFWAWWRNHWNKRDTSFIMVAHDMSIPARLAYYDTLHNPKNFDFHPHRRILEHSYAVMIDKLIKEAVK